MLGLRMVRCSPPVWLRSPRRCCDLHVVFVFVIQIAAIRKGFEEILSTYCYAQGFSRNPVDLLLHARVLR